MNYLTKFRKKLFIRKEFKKYFIRKELKKYFISRGFKSELNFKYLDVLVDALMKGSGVAHTDFLNSQKNVLEHNKNLLYEDIKVVIEKHYKDKSIFLEKENLRLKSEVKQKEDKLNKLRTKVSQTVYSSIG